MGLLGIKLDDELFRDQGIYLLPGGEVVDFAFRLVRIHLEPLGNLSDTRALQRLLNEQVVLVTLDHADLFAGTDADEVDYEDYH